MLNAGHRLLEWARQPDAGMKSFATSFLAELSLLCIPFRDMTMERVKKTVKVPVIVIYFVIHAVLPVELQHNI